MFRSLLARLLALLFSAAIAGHAAGARAIDTPEIAFESKQFHFALSYPSFFEPADADQALVGLFLRAKEGGAYPTFNVLIQPGKMETGSFGERELGGRIEQSYHEVGITDAKIEHAEHIDVGGRAAFLAELAFRRAETLLVARTVLIDGESQHYILTFIDDVGGFAGRRESYDRMLETFSLPPLPGTRRPPASYASRWIAAFSALLLAAATLLYFRQRRRGGTTKFS